MAFLRRRSTVAGSADQRAACLAAVREGERYEGLLRTASKGVLTSGQALIDASNTVVNAYSNAVDRTSEKIGDFADWILGRNQNILSAYEDEGLGVIIAGVAFTAGELAVIVAGVLAAGIGVYYLTWNERFNPLVLQQQRAQQLEAQGVPAAEAAAQAAKQRLFDAIQPDAIIRTVTLGTVAYFGLALLTGRRK